MSNSSNLVINNKKIVDFYNKNPHFNPEIHLLFIVEALENTLNSSKDHVNTSMLSSIYKSLSASDNDRKVLTTMLNTLNENFNSIKDTVNKIPHDILTLTTLKISESKDAYISELKELLGKNDSNTQTLLTQVIQDNTKGLIDKTSSVLNDILPNNQKFIESQFKLFQQTINLDLIKSMNDSKNTNIDSKLNEFATQLDIKLTNLVHKCINSTEERLGDKINSVYETNNKVFTNQDKLITSISDITDKFKNSTYKGNYGENILFNVVSSIYPTADVVDTTKDGSKCGDLLLKRDGKDTIMFENKVYTGNVPGDEVKKFQRDVILHKYHGIFLSQSSGIANKNNFQIELSTNNILLYVHKVNYSPEIIKLGVDVIDTISEFIHNQDLSTDAQITINKSLLETINREVSSFIMKKKDIIDFIKEQQKSLLHKLDDMNISSTLLSLLNQHIGTINEQTGYFCNICNRIQPSLRSAASISAHRRHCMSKKENTISTNSNDEVSLNEQIDSIVTPIDSPSDNISLDVSRVENSTTIPLPSVDTISVTSVNTEKKRKTKATK